MTADILLDSENLFYRVGAQLRHAPTADSIQDEFFERESEAGERRARVLSRTFHAVVRWFESASRNAVARIDSYGKLDDPSVEALLSALGADATVRGRIVAAREDRDTGEDVELVSSGLRIMHHSVGRERNAAEQALVADFRRRLGAPARAEAFLLGGEDHDAIYPADHARMADPTIKVWIVLPVASVVWRRFHRLGSYPHVRPANVLTLDEVLAATVVGETAARRHRADVRERREAAIERARRRAGYARREDPAGNQLEAALARLVGVHTAGLSGAHPGAAEWSTAVGDPWLVEAVETGLRRAATPAEVEALHRGQVAPARAAHLVRVCGILRLRAEQPDVAFGAICDLIVGLCGPFPYYRDVLAALAESALID